MKIQYLCDRLTFMKRYQLLISALIFIICSPVFTEVKNKLPEIFNGNLSEAEITQLEKGEILIRNIGKAKNMSLLPVNKFADDCITGIQKLKPNYLAEVIQVKKIREGDEPFARLEKILSDVKSFEGIPYYSVNNDTYYDLFSRVDILSKQDETAPDKRQTLISTEIHMNPFLPFKIDWELTRTPEGIFFHGINRDKIIYEYYNIKCVSPENMEWYITAFEKDGYLVLYGAGGVDGTSLFFIKDRIENSFIGRVTSFCKEIFARLE